MKIIKNILSQKPIGMMLLTGIASFSIGISFLFSGYSRKTWWVKGMSDVQIEIFMIANIFIGFMCLLIFSVNLINFIKRYRLDYLKFQNIIRIILFWFVMFILYNIDKKYFPNEIFAVLLIAFVVYAGTKQEEFNRMVNEIIEESNNTDQKNEA